jgi:hypothetical protein
MGMAIQCFDSRINLRKHNAFVGVAEKRTLLAIELEKAHKES